MTVGRLRPLAEADLVERTRYYSAEGGIELGRRFFDAAVASLRVLEKMPSTGSPRVGELCDIPGLRVRRVAGLPVGWFYFVRPEHAHVVRLLSDAQDLPVILADLDRADRWGVDGSVVEDSVAEFGEVGGVGVGDGPGSAGPAGHKRSSPAT